MGREHRWVVSLCFLVSMVLTLVAAPAAVRHGMAGDGLTLGRGRGLGTSQVAMLPGNWHGRTLILLILTLIQWASLAPCSNQHMASFASFASCVPESQLRFGTRLLAATGTEAGSGPGVPRRAQAFLHPFGPTHSAGSYEELLETLCGRVRTLPRHPLMTRRICTASGRHPRCPASLSCGLLQSPTVAAVA